MTKHEKHRRARGRLRHPRRHRHGVRRHPDPLPDPRPRRARAQRQEDGRLRPRAQHAPPRPRQDAQVGGRAEAADGAGRRHRRLLPEGLRGRGLRPRRHQGHPRLERGARPGQDRQARPHAEARRPRHRLRRRRGERRRPLEGGAEARHRRSSVFVEIDCGAGRCGVTTTEAVVEIAKAVAAAPGLRFLGIQAYQGAMQHLDELRGPQGQARRRRRPGRRTPSTR